MRKTTRILLLAVFTMLILVCSTRAQTSNKGTETLVLSKEVQEKMAHMQPHNTPLAGSSKGQLLLPESVAETMKSRSRPKNPRPMSEQEKRRILLDRVKHHVDAKKKSGAS